MSLEVQNMKVAPIGILEKFIKFDTTALEASINLVVTSALSDFYILETMIRTNAQNINFVYLQSFILFQVMHTCKATPELFSELINHISTCLTRRINNQKVIINAESTFEVQREEGKQNIINIMKTLNKNDRDLIKHLKERGLTDIMKEMAQGNMPTFATTDHEHKPHVNDYNMEIYDDLKQNQGENPDFDNED